MDSATYCKECAGPCQYPITEIPIERLEYKLLSPDYDGQEREPLTQNHDTFALWETRFKSRGPEAIVPDEIRRVWDSIARIGMVNPMIVKKQTYRENFDGSLFYVVVGNHRLTVCRAMNHHKPGTFREIPCRIAKERDSWNDDTEAWRAHPYKSVVRR